MGGGVGHVILSLTVKEPSHSARVDLALSIQNFKNQL